MTKEEVVSKLIKLRSMIEKGVGGEKTNAQRLFDTLCDKYAITEEDLSVDKIKPHVVKVDEKFEKELLIQIYFTRYKKEGYRFSSLDLTKMSRRERKLLDDAYGIKDWNVMIFCTDSDFIQIMFELDVYKKSFEKSLEAFFYAFLDTNKLLVTGDNKEEREPTKEEIDMFHEAMLYRTFMNRTQIQKQIE